MALANPVKVLEVCRVPPHDSVAQISLPLTFFDIFWLKFLPVEKLFFYSLTPSIPPFLDSILPKLKHSLSLALSHYLPLSGNLTWPLHSHKPFIQYIPSDSVSLTVAESDADFEHLSSNNVGEAAQFRPLVPSLQVSDTEASIMSLQVTFFPPHRGFCIGITTHHAVVDGQTASMFMKSWAYYASTLGQNSSLPPELTPFFDRTVIKDQAGLEMLYLSQLSSKFSRSLQVFLDLKVPPNLVRGTFHLSRGDIEKLRKRVLSVSKEASEALHLSTFVLTCAHVLVCMVKARGGESNRMVCFLFPVDYRARLDPPVPATYIGNGVGYLEVLSEATHFMEEEGLAFVAEKMSNAIKGLMESKGVVVGAKEWVTNLWSLPPGTQRIGLAGSPRFELYETDFGWGRPKKVEVVSIDRSGAISIMKSRDGMGEIEIGLVLQKHEMDLFTSLFVNGLKAQ